MVLRYPVDIQLVSVILFKHCTSQIKLKGSQSLIHCALIVISCKTEMANYYDLEHLTHVYNYSYHEPQLRLWKEGRLARLELL